MAGQYELSIFRDGPEDQVCSLIAEKVRQLRADAGESQRNFSARAGVPLRTYKRFEANGSGTIQTFVRVLRACGRTSYLMYLFPQPLPVTRAMTFDAAHGELLEIAKEKARLIESQMEEERRRNPDTHD